MYSTPHKLKAATVAARSTKNDNHLAGNPDDPQKTATGAGYFFSLRNGSQWFVSNANYSAFLLEYKDCGDSVSRSACVRKHGTRS